MRIMLCTALIAVAMLPGMAGAGKFQGRSMGIGAPVPTAPEEVPASAVPNGGAAPSAIPENGVVTSPGTSTGMSYNPGYCSECNGACHGHAGLGCVAGRVHRCLHNKACHCGCNQSALARSQMRPWHGCFYDPAWGAPLALVVPPTAERTTDWGWGVGNTRTTRIDHQFQRPFPNGNTAPAGSYGFAPTPPWPSDTTQFGVYYVRGPW
jgi:hypothetical protein